MVRLALALFAVLPTAAAAAEPSPRFDYVVVGAGAAGSVVASRLSEDPAITVLVLEAGGPDTDPRIQRPSAYRDLPGSPLDWRYRTEREPHLGGRRIPWPRGKVWGGSGSLSAMVYVRGHPRDFDLWEALGNPGWGYRHVLPYFKRAEDHEGGPTPHHGAGGPQRVADPRWIPPLSQAFVAAALQAGLRRNEDFNGETLEGVGFFQFNQKDGERHSTARAYLRPALGRANLAVESHALATRILLDGPRAVGVAYVKDGRDHEVRAEREVILCAGTIGSPQLLMLSGVGPAEHLRSLGIPVVRDLPGVGGNLQDHPRVPLTYASKRALGPATPAEREKARRDYERDRTGPLASNGIGAGAFVTLSEDELLPEVQIVPTAGPEEGTFSLHVVLLRPSSRGRIRLRSRDPTDRPLIQANYLSEQRDLDLLARGLERARLIASAPALAGYRGEERGPERWEEEAIRRYIRANVASFFHPVGTCAMGADEQAVVDARLRVRGIAALRVIDASVMPTLIGGATHAATAMIAEKGADLVRSGG